MCIEACPVRQRTEIEAIAAAGVENDVVGFGGNNFRDPLQQRTCDSAIMQSPPRCHSGRGVAWLLRSTILRLKQVDVSTTRDVEGMLARAKQPLLFAHQRQVASADRAQEHFFALSGDQLEPAIGFQAITPPAPDDGVAEESGNPEEESGEVFERQQE